LPSHPNNVSKMLAVDLEWYANYREKALEMYMELLSE